MRSNEQRTKQTRNIISSGHGGLTSRPYRWQSSGFEIAIPRRREAARSGQALAFAAAAAQNASPQ